MRTVARLLPHPVLSLSLLIIWLTLNETVQPGQILLGAALGVGLPLLSKAYWPERPPFHRLPLLWRLFFRVNWDIVVACATVARLTFTRRTATLQPQFAAIPVDCRDRYAQILLVSIVTITPGTLVADFDHEHGYILVHWLHEPDVDQAIARIKTRYETPLKEILG
jgi:multicomponent K+:H+ antiporter subunit E